jgi:hypothetical protein
MECPQQTIRLAQPPAERGRFSWTGLLAAILAAPLFGLLWAWVAHVVEAYVAPIILFPILLGVFAGLSIVAVTRFAQIGHRPTIVLAAVLAGAVAAAGQHGLGYLTAYYGPRASLGVETASHHEVIAALAREMTPSFSQYMLAQADRGRPLWAGYVAQGWVVWMSWTIDALLVIAAAVVVTLPAMQLPYCNRCGTWYRTVRSGKLDLHTATSLAELFGVEQIDRPRSPRYRLSACQNGCGPTRCELSWERGNGTVDLARVWLDPVARNQVATILDGSEGEQHEASIDEGA